MTQRDPPLKFRHGRWVDGIAEMLKVYLWRPLPRARFVSAYFHLWGLAPPFAPQPLANEAGRRTMPAP